MDSLPQPFATPRVSQTRSSLEQPRPDSSELQVANRKRLVAIALQKEKIQALEREAQQRKLDDVERAQQRKLNDGKRAQQRKLDDENRRLAPRARQRQPDDANTRRVPQSEMFTVRTPQEKIREREQQRKHDEAAIKRIEQRKVAEQLATSRGETSREKSRLSSPATVERNWELWRLENKARRLEQREQTAGPRAKRRLVGKGVQNLRYSSMF